MVKLCSARTWMAALLVMGGLAEAAYSADEQQALRRTPIVEAYERARDSVVNISAIERVVVPRWGRNIFGDIFQLPPRELAERSVGSGAVIHEDGFIVTNAHVVAAGTDLTVAFADGREYPAQLIASDRDRDLAVIKVDADHPLTPIPLGRSDDLMIGETTIAVGNPVGLNNTVTVGIVSALHREFQVGQGVVYRDVIQTDASINPGNSGGPLLNVLGEMIGINTAIRTDVQNIGFAIPIDQLRDAFPDLLDVEKLRKVQLGIRTSVADPPKVIEVRPDSPAYAAGIRPNDIVRSINGKPVRNGLDVYVQLLRQAPGDRVSVDLVREGKSRSVDLELRPVPKPDGQKLASDKLGIQISDADDALKRRLGLPADHAVIIEGVEPRGPANRGELRPGDVLRYLGRYRINDVDQVGQLLENLAKDDPVDVVVWRYVRRQWWEVETTIYAR